jgi:hypothetical protein
VGVSPSFSPLDWGFPVFFLSFLYNVIYYANFAKEAFEMWNPPTRRSKDVMFFIRKKSKQRRNLLLVESTSKEEKQTCAIEAQALGPWRQATTAAPPSCK